MPACRKTAGTKGTHICLHVAEVKPGRGSQIRLQLRPPAGLPLPAAEWCSCGSSRGRSFSALRECCFTEPSGLQALVSVEMSKRYSMFYFLILFAFVLFNKKWQQQEPFLLSCILFSMQVHLYSINITAPAKWNLSEK